MPHRNSRGRLVLRFLSIFIFTSIPCHAASPGFEIVTIDDASGTGPFYTSPSSLPSAPKNSTDPDIPHWTNQECAECSRKPNLSSLKNGTYTAVYLPPNVPYTYNITFQFTGTTIGVYLVLSNQSPTSCSFLLDGNVTAWTGYTDDEFQYNVLAFSEDGLDSRIHQLTISAESLPDRPNYANFDYAQLTVPNNLPSITPTAVRLVFDSSNSTDSSTPSPSATSSSHPTVSAIAGGVVGGFLAVLAFILFISFYRNRRVRDLEKTALSFPTKSPSNASISNEEQHLLEPLAPPQLIPNTYRSSNSRYSSRLNTHSNPHSGITPFPVPYRFSPNPAPQQLRSQSSGVRLVAPREDPEYRDRIRQQRQEELNHRLETVRSQIRSLKSSYVQDQRHSQNQIQRQPAHDDRSNPGRPVFHLVPGGAPDPVTGRRPGEPTPPNSREPMVTPAMLEDMRADMQHQIQIMNDQIQYLQAQRNSPYVQALTDEPPPGYADVVNPH